MKRLPSKVGPDNLRSVIFGGLSPESAQVARNNLNDFARYTKAASAEASIASLIRLTNSKANSLVEAYREHLKRRGMKPTTIKRRIAAITSEVNRARRAGVTTLVLDVRNPDVKAVRPSFGEGEWATFLKAAESQATDKGGARDLAIVLLLHDLAMWKREVVSLNWPKDVDLRASGLHFRGRWHELNEACADAIERWLQFRGNDWAGPLFTGERDDRVRSRLSGHAVNHAVNVIATKAGMAGGVYPHLLRLSGIDRARALDWGLEKLLEFTGSSQASLRRHVASTPVAGKKPVASLPSVSSGATAGERKLSPAEAATLARDRFCYEQHKAGEKFATIAALSTSTPGWEELRPLKTRESARKAAERHGARLKKLAAEKSN